MVIELNIEAFYARLNLEYGNRLEIYKTVLEY